jgi:hypothetical protein
MARRRPTPLTAEKRAAFLAALADGRTVKEAAAATDIARQQWYAYRTADETLAAAWDAALDEGTEVLEAEARRRAVEGVTKERGIYHKGICVGTYVETEYSDTLLIFLLKARRPHVYRERWQGELTGADAGPVKLVVEVVHDRAD